MLLIATGYASAIADAPPLWVIGGCYLSMGIGTLFGGWRIVRTMGQKITKLKPVGGFCAETGGAITLFIASWLGIPVSTTHTITGAIVGVGATQKLSAVRWGVAGNIVWAWILTIPASAALVRRRLVARPPFPVSARNRRAAGPQSFVQRRAVQISGALPPSIGTIAPVT